MTIPRRLISRINTKGRPTAAPPNSTAIHQSPGDSRAIDRDSAPMLVTHYLSGQSLIDLRSLLQRVPATSNFSLFLAHDTPHLHKDGRQNRTTHDHQLCRITCPIFSPELKYSNTKLLVSLCSIFIISFSPL